MYMRILMKNTIRLLSGNINKHDGDGYIPNKFVGIRSHRKIISLKANSHWLGVPFGSPHPLFGGTQNQSNYSNT